MWWATWWAWWIAALVLAIVETLLPGYVFLGFAAGAGVTGLVLLLDGPPAAWLAASLPSLLLVFAVASLAAWLVMRRVFAYKGASVKTFDRDINDP
jgi:membrane protein implicated in regulation of membrane protease activity